VTPVLVVERTALNCPQEVPKATGRRGRAEGQLAAPLVHRALAGIAQDDGEFGRS